MACLFGHKWNGCKCSKCGKNRDEQHNWNGCKCTICGAARDEGHDLDLCFGRCKKCGKSCEVSHAWNGCKCSRCGKMRNEQHEWDLCFGKCKVCGIAGKKEGHTFEEHPNGGTPCEKVCSICGWAGRVHKWEPLNESKCEYSCSVCGQKAFIHKGYKELCPLCGEKITVFGGAIEYDYHKSINYGGDGYEFYTNSGGRRAAGRMNCGTCLWKSSNFDEYSTDNYALEFLWDDDKHIVMTKP
ncbi:MAG: hypothetical protein FWG72_00140 [Oscillospiraceae bacterium]|nr:hypothetical protein [Oscillospiraceae bacterium]